jgi:hypothetical protein
LPLPVSYLGIRTVEDGFELAGELPVEVAFAMTESDAQKFLEMLAT